MVCFADINVSQSSVATYARCGGVFDIPLTANLPTNLPVKKIFLNQLRIDRIVVMSLCPVAPFFWPTLYIVPLSYCSNAFDKYYYYCTYYGLYSRTTWVSRYQKGKTSLELNEAREDGVLGCSGISWTI